MGHSLVPTKKVNTAMVFSHRYRYLYRSGPQDRQYPGRFTYIKGTGWFVYLRGDLESYEGIEVKSGIAGPFDSRFDARVYLVRLIKQSNPGLVGSKLKAS
ncbi:MAG: hypothetical protein PVG75_04705 [Thioalkalispiraceae bacterium]